MAEEEKGGSARIGDGTLLEAGGTFWAWMLDGPATDSGRPQRFACGGFMPPGSHFPGQVFAAGVGSCVPPHRCFATAEACVFGALLYYSDDAIIAEARAARSLRLAAWIKANGVGKLEGEAHG